MSLSFRFLAVPRSALLFCAGFGLLGLPMARAAFNLSTLHTFDAAADGNVPYPALVQGADGNFYGVNSTGGRSNNGTIFRVNANGAFTVLNTFTQASQGTTPEGGVVQARDGNFYGTTFTGGGGSYGTLYQMIPSTGKLAILSNFTNGDPGGSPVGALLEGIDGLLYGTAQYGGNSNYGTIFRAAPPSGAATTLATVAGGLAGYYPQSDLVQAYDGNFYGTTTQGGTNNFGTFFRVTPAGGFTVLYSFTGGTDGGRPLRGVVQGTDGAFYGVGNQGGAYQGGAIFRAAVAGNAATVTGLYSFIPAIGDGSNALGSLTLASDGNFYGTTARGGANAVGTIYRVTPSGGYALVYSFANGTDGGFPVGGLTQGNDGKLYGTTAGQNGSAGTIFKLDLGLSAPAPTPTYLLQANANVGDTILIKGDHFVGTTGVSFVGPNGAAVAAADFTVLSKTVLRVVVPTGALTGVVTVTANALSASTPATLTIAAVTTPVVIPTVSVLASAPVAAKADGTPGKFKVTRSGGDNTTALKVAFKIAPVSTAVFATDYTLVCKGAALGASGTITIPAGKASVGVKVVPIRSTTPAPATTVFLKVKKSDRYTLGNPLRAVVQVTASGAGQ